jgi:serine protease inhibitor
MRSRSFRPMAAAAGLLTLAAACARAQDKPRIDAQGVKPLDTTPWVPAEGQALVRSPDYAAFGLTLFHRLAEAKPTENLVVSPLSAGLALSMLANGATGETLAGIQRTLATGMGLEGLNPANAALADSLRTEDVELSIANSLWARQGIPFLPAFLEQNRRFYGAEVASLNLSTPEAARRINEWASRSTSGRIPEMVDGPLDPEVILYLMNAVYFKGRWQDEFRANATRPRTFHAPGGDVQRPMMERTGSYGYMAGEGFQGLRLPYRGGRFAMYVLLPDAAASVAELRGRMTAETWRGWMGEFRPREVHVVMPRYRMSLESRLNAPLQAMGMASAFDPARASFNAMLNAEFLARQNAYVSEAKQKVFIEVNEEGTEAAAVTGVEVRATSAPAPPMEFVVDRPFILAIRDDQTGALLFIGQVNDPVTQ